MSKSPAQPADQQLLGDIRSLIEQGRQQLASTVNSALTLLYWQIGQRIRSEVPQGECAPYGEHIVSALSRQLEASNGRGIRIAEYLAALPSKELLQAKLHEAIALSRARLDTRSERQS